MPQFDLLEKNELSYIGARTGVEFLYHPLPFQYQMEIKRISLSAIDANIRGQIRAELDPGARAELSQKLAAEKITDVFIESKCDLELLAVRCCLVSMRKGGKTHNLERRMEQIGGAPTMVCDLEEITRITADHNDLGLDLADLIDVIMEGVSGEKKTSKPQHGLNDADSTTDVQSDAPNPSQS